MSGLVSVCSGSGSGISPVPESGSGHAHCGALPEGSEHPAAERIPARASDAMIVLYNIADIVSVKYNLTV